MAIQLPSDLPQGDLALALWTPVCFGQNAQLSGLVRDPAGLSVSGAGVNIPNSRQVAGETPDRMRQALTAFLP